MKINGTEYWIGNKPNKTSRKQQLYLDLLKELGHDIPDYLNSETAYKYLHNKLNIIDKIQLSKEYNKTNKISYFDVWYRGTYRCTIKNFISNGKFINYKIEFNHVSYLRHDPQYGNSLRKAYKRRYW